MPDSPPCDWKNFADSLKSELATALSKDLEQLKGKLMATQADLDAAIAALPGQIQTAVENALTPVIAAIEAKAAGTPVDFSPEIASLNAIPATVASGIAAAVTPAPAPANDATPAAPAS
jgi:hypothetical protein